MSERKIDERDSTIVEYEKIIEELMKENQTLKNRITDLEIEIMKLKESGITFEEISAPVVQRDIKQIEEFKPITQMKKEVISEPFHYQDTVSLELGKGPIVEGISRRECPICGNTNKLLIHELIDRDRIISAYPKMYGKKYKCGSCGREWRLPLEM